MPVLGILCNRRNGWSSYDLMDFQHKLVLSRIIIFLQPSWLYYTVLYMLKIARNFIKQIEFSYYME
jgi:hypothetical protein